MRPPSRNRVRSEIRAPQIADPIDAGDTADLSRRGGEGVENRVRFELRFRQGVTIERDNLSIGEKGHGVDAHGTQSRTYGGNLWRDSHTQSLIALRLATRTRELRDGRDAMITGERDHHRVRITKL